MSSLPSAAAQLEFFMRPLLDILTAPGHWLIEFVPLLLAGALPLAAGALMLLARR